jgi:EAL domain-containing protein (putative c-di-GMP-specific phosphodiesterase class I)
MQQLLDTDLPGRLLSVLNSNGLTPDQVKLEITERFLLHDARHAQRQLAALKTAGFEIYMDDFGVGYSNLSSVLDYPLDCIKLDRSLIRRLPEDRRSRLMAETLLTLFHRLDKSLIVEGAETEEQAEYLTAQGADMIQGFYYACPMPQEALEEFFRDQGTASAT